MHNRRNIIKSLAGLATVVALPNFAKDKYPKQDTSNMFDLFKIDKTLPFLYYSYGMGEMSQCMSLNLGNMPIIEQPSIDDLWTISDNIKGAYKNDIKRICAVNILRNHIAYRSRRGIGNILIVPKESDKAWYETNEHSGPLFKRTNLKIIVDETLEHNELRVCYWKIHYKRINRDGTITGIRETNEPQCIDGGLAMTPNGVQAITKTDNIMIDYHDYFVRGFM